MGLRAAPRGRTSWIAGLTAAGLALSAAGAAAQVNRVFVTSTAQDGNLGGLAGADAICASRAAAAGLGGSWVAWLSTSTVNAVDRLAAGSGPFVRAADVNAVIANDIPDLTDSSLDRPVLVDEFGVATSTAAFTATTSAGILDLANGTCSDWTSNIGNAPTAGVTDTATLFWTQATASPGGAANRLYCFDNQPFVAAPAVPTPFLLVLAILLFSGGVYLHRRRRTV